MGEEKVLYSVKMRSSLGGAHGVGGQHISGAERIVTKNSVEQEMIFMLHRAWEHDRGAADFIQFKVEAVRHEGITCCPLLPLYQIDTATKEEGRAAAKKELLRSGVTETAIGKGFALFKISEKVLPFKVATASNISLDRSSRSRRAIFANSSPI